MLKVLVLCTGNSCRSIMAEALLNHYGKGRIQAFSAGSFPTGKIHPMSLATLKEMGLPTEGYRSKSWDEFTNQPIDVIITVCDDAAGESCPLFPGKPIKVHWGVSDPAKFQGTEEEVRTEFKRVYTILKNRIQALVQLPIESMDRNELQEKLNAIGQL
jgi:arsenate reductase